jgi:PAS domain S-box-containing protein
VVLALLGLAYGVVHLRLRAARAHQRDLARQVEERTADLKEQVEVRRQAEEAAGHERDLLHSLMDNIPDLIYFKDMERRYTRVNGALAEAVGLSDVADAAGKSDADFFSEEFARAARADEDSLLVDATPVLGKVEWDARTGRFYLMTKVPIRDASGKVGGLVGISKDVTAQREAEEKLRENLERFREVVRKVAEGDLTRRGEEGDDSLGEIARSVNQMLEGFAGILTEVRDAAFSVSTASAEILAASQQIAKGAKYGRDQVHSTSAAVEEMAVSMGQVAKNADQSAQAAQQVLQHLEAADRAVGVTVKGMGEIDATVSATADKMRVLGERSEKVFEIIDMIEELASRSELLSLNASIEASHAGDAGRGFAVVAEEMRRLAESSNKATKNVTQIVKAMASETEAALAAMEASTGQVKRGLELSDQARLEMDQVSELVRGATELAQQISSSSGEQTLATRTVAEAMQVIAGIVEQSAAGGAETTRAVQDLVDMSDRLNRAISLFKIETEPESGTATRE